MRSDPPFEYQQPIFVRQASSLAHGVEFIASQRVLLLARDDYASWDEILATVGLPVTRPDLIKSR